jgi:hypothetical protein
MMDFVQSKKLNAGICEILINKFKEGNKKYFELVVSDFVSLDQLGIGLLRVEELKKLRDLIDEFLESENDDSLSQV